MPRTSTIKTHPQRAEIEEALVNGTPYRSITERFGVSAGAIARYKKEHLPEKLTKAKEAEEVAEADDLLGQIRDLQRRTLAVLSDAEAEEKHRLRLKAIAEARRNIELLGKLAGELQQEGTVTIVNSPQYVEVRQTIIDALRPFPEARTAVAQALSVHE